MFWREVSLVPYIRGERYDAFRQIDLFFKQNQRNSLQKEVLGVIFLLVVFAINSKHVSLVEYILWGESTLVDVFD